MHFRTSMLAIICICCTTSAFAADAPDFDTFYSLYKTAASQNDITVGADLTATRILTVAGAETTLINGGGYAFNGGGLNGFVVSRYYTFNLSNGGAFSVSGDAATITKSYNNFARTQGAVIANLGGNLTIGNSAFASNSATVGGGVLYQGDGATMSVSDSVFDGNRVTRGDGGVLYNEYGASATFDNTVFQNNSVRDYGGVIFNDGTLNISNSTFASNTADSGGALYNSNLMTLRNVRFIGNTGTSDVGAIYTTGNMDLTGGVFENNSGATGGAIGNYGIIGDGLFSVVRNSQFNGNSATYGGAIYNWDDIYIVDSTFANNNATDGGGAIFNLGELYLIATDADVTFSNNTAAGVSNAIYSSGTFSMNAAPDKSMVFNDAINGDGEIIINRSYIYDNQNVPTGGTVVLGADMSGFSGNVTMYDGILQIADGGTFFSADNLNISGGTLDIGTAAISANTVTFGASSTLRLNINNANTYGSVSANSFNISDGANLSVILAPDAMGDDTTMRVQLLRGSAPVDDAFAPTIDNNIYMFTQIGDGWYEIAQQNDYTDVINDAGGTQNNLNTAAVWILEPPATKGLEHEIYVRMNELLQTDAVEYIRALTALAPSPAPLMQIMGTSYVSRFSSLLDSDSTDRYYIANGKLWASGFGGGGHLRGDGRQYADFDMYGFGGAVGAEYSHNDWTFGASYMYQYDRLKSWARTIHAPTHGGGLYAIYSPYNIVWRGAATMFYTDMNETKNVAGFAVDNNPSIYTYGAWTDIGYRIAGLNWHATPRAGARYTLMHRGAVTDDADQTTESKNLHFLTAYADVSVARANIMLGNINLIPELTAGASYDLRSDTDNMRVSINGTSYLITGAHLPRWAFNSELKLRAVFSPITELEFGAGVELRRDYNNYMAHLRGILRF